MTEMGREGGRDRERERERERERFSFSKEGIDKGDSLIV